MGRKRDEEEEEEEEKKMEMEMHFLMFRCKDWIFAWFSREWAAASPWFQSLWNEKVVPLRENEAENFLNSDLAKDLEREKEEKLGIQDENFESEDWNIEREREKGTQELKDSTVIEEQVHKS